MICHNDPNSALSQQKTHQQFLTQLAMIVYIESLAITDDYLT